MDFERSHFGKKQLWIVEHFHLHKKVPVLMNHNIWKNCMLWFITKYRYLFVKMKMFNYSELHFAGVTFLQNPYFNKQALLELPFLKILKKNKDFWGNESFGQFLLTLRWSDLFRKFYLIKPIRSIKAKKLYNCSHAVLLYDIIGVSAYLRFLELK